MQLSRFLINRSQCLVVEVQAPDAKFSRVKRAECDALQIVFKLAMTPRTIWRGFLAALLVPKVVIQYIAVCFGWLPVPPPALDLENAKNNKKIGKKIGFNQSKKAVNPSEFN